MIKIQLISSQLFLNPKISAWLHILRWLAAFVVLLTHVRERLFLPLDQIAQSDRNLVIFLWSFIAGFGHIAVVIFFVLSGYLVGGASLLELKRTGNIRLRKYFVNRFTRLYVVLLPALVLTFLLDQVGQQYFKDQEVYTWSAANSSSRETLLCNLAFLQTVSCYSYGSNRPLWSLANEFWYYVIWPLLLSPFMYARPFGQRAWLFIAGLGIVGMLVWFQRGYAAYFIVPYMLIWVLGVIPTMIHRPIFRSSTVALVSLLLVVVGMRVAFRGEIWEQFRTALPLDFVIAIVLVSTLSSLVHSKGTPGYLARLGIHKKFADFSFTLYASHMPILTILSVIASHYVELTTASAGNAKLALSITITAATTLICYALSLIFERNTSTIRHRFQRWCKFDRV